MSSVHKQDIVTIESRSLDWVQRVVIGLNLCPFANRVVKSGHLLMHTELSDDMATVLATVAAQYDKVLGEGAHGVSSQNVSEQAKMQDGDAKPQSTTDDTVLVILPNGFSRFEQFLDLVDLAEALLIDLDLEGVLQIATFHPEYQFTDASYDDAANFTNRSPYPMLHILQESAVEAAVEQYPNTEDIPEQNIARLRTMDVEELKRLVEGELH